MVSPLESPLVPGITPAAPPWSTLGSASVDGEREQVWPGFAIAAAPPSVASPRAVANDLSARGLGGPFCGAWGDGPASTWSRGWTGTTGALPAIGGSTRQLANYSSENSGRALEPSVVLEAQGDCVAQCPNKSSDVHSNVGRVGAAVGAVGNTQPQPQVVVAAQTPPRSGGEGAPGSASIPTVKRRQARISDQLARRLQSQLKHAAQTSGGFQKILRKYDKDRNGTLTAEELKRLVRVELRVTQDSISNRDIDTLVAALDDDSTGTLSADEIVDFIERGAATFHSGPEAAPAGEEHADEPIVSTVSVAPDFSTVTISAASDYPGSDVGILHHPMAEGPLGYVASIDPGFQAALLQFFASHATAKLAGGAAYHRSQTNEVDDPKAVAEAARLRKEQKRRQKIHYETARRLHILLKCATQNTSPGRLVRKFDKDRSGSLSTDEVKRLLRRQLRISAETLGDEDIVALVGALDDGDGDLVIDDLLEFLEKGPSVMENSFLEGDGSLEELAQQAPEEAAQLSPCGGASVSAATPQVAERPVPLGDVSARGQTRGQPKPRKNIMLTGKRHSDFARLEQRDVGRSSTDGGEAAGRGPSSAAKGSVDKGRTRDSSCWHQVLYPALPSESSALIHTPRLFSSERPRSARNVEVSGSRGVVGGIVASTPKVVGISRDLRGHSATATVEWPQISNGTGGGLSAAARAAAAAAALERLSSASALVSGSASPRTGVELPPATPLRQRMRAARAARIPSRPRPVPTT
eukprot:TRINITY_DN73881_c0_g1_i1.p1 TRINITY_DN73881_c0_g1~~TRINITY_DN73881_c0_g1_i1.p1  ORF type:complete len:754 (-),score=124.73 TRINITY_DN73881_c0_g1_i1:79-2340(-)